MPASTFAAIDTTYDLKIGPNLGTTECLGNSVASAGDVNNDGYDDVIVGANCATSNTGRAYI
jgi:hypothetical protein